MNGRETFPVEYRCAHQAVEVNTTVFYGKLLVVQQQLLFTVEDDLASLNRSDVVLEVISKQLQLPSSFGTPSPTQCVSLVSVGDAQHFEITVSSNPQLRRVDAGVKSREHESRGANWNGDRRDTFDLRTLLVDHHMINGRGKVLVGRGLVGPKA